MLRPAAYLPLRGYGIRQFTPQTSTYLPMILSLPCATCYNAVLLGKELLVLADSEVIYLQLPLGKAPNRVQEIGSKIVQRSPANVMAVGLSLYWFADREIRKLDIDSLMSRFEDYKTVY